VKKERKLSKIIQEFSRFAYQYECYNTIQMQVAKTLVENIPLGKYDTILDIGCGSGAVFKNFQKQFNSFKVFTALDSSCEMLKIHPEKKNVIKICTDFNYSQFLKTLPLEQYDLVLSSSALQWSKDLDFTLIKLSKLSDRLHAAIFTSGTFKRLHETVGIASPIHSVEEVKKTVYKHYHDVSFMLHHYTLAFKSVREMFQYIKKSGVSGGEKRLNYKQTKYLMENYPLDHLEFEVLFVEAKN
jgi:malonyl-CoA O-methyltransferase